MQVTPKKTSSMIIPLDESEDDILQITKPSVKVNASRITATFDNVPESPLMKTKGKIALKRRKEKTPKKTGSSTPKKSPENKKQRLKRVSKKVPLSPLVYAVDSGEEENEGEDSEESEGAFSAFSDEEEEISEEEDEEEEEESDYDE